ncbi:MAG: IS30 family transposase [Lachnospiraceae bacterium]|nr:IS30 family transposase [Lachnospiraceae bacterium]
MEKQRKFRTLNRSDRLQLEALYNNGTPVKEIANYLGFHISTIYRELKRGFYTHTNSDLTECTKYSTDLGQLKHDTLNENRGTQLKIGHDHKYAEFLEKMISEKGYSPEAALYASKTCGETFETTICVRTLYNYIDRDLFLSISNKDLPVKGHRTRDVKKVHPVQKRRSAGRSIDQRPDAINAREEFGHWEMDTVKGKKNVSKSCLLVLSERKTRKELVYKMPDQGAASVVDRIDWLEEHLGESFSKLFKTITMDNGVEFSDVKGLETSKISDGKRTDLYYCHAYHSWERGTNENINKMVRRKVPKGADIDQYSESDIREAKNWINHYPRRIFHGKSADDLFLRELNRIDDLNTEKVAELLAI